MWWIFNVETINLKLLRIFFIISMVLDVRYCHSLVALFQECKNLHPFVYSQNEYFYLGESSKLVLSLE